MHSDGTADEIRLRMSLVRLGLAGNVEGIVTEARRLADWRYHVAAHPWALVAASIAVGYLAVPARRETVQPDNKALEWLARRNGVVVPSKPAPSRGRVLLQSALGMAGSTLLRVVLLQVGRHVGRVLGDPATQPPVVETGTP